MNEKVDISFDDIQKKYLSPVDGEKTKYLN